MKTNFTLKTTIKNGSLLLAMLIWVLALPAFGQTKHIVEVTNRVFTPDKLTIEQGDTVEWQNIEGFHNVNGTQTDYPDNPEYFGNETGTGWTFSHVFTTVGDYDYQCDPHADEGMTGEIKVKEPKYNVTVQFSGMMPHVGQNLYLAVIEKSSGKEIERKMEAISSESFSVEVSGIEMDHSYYVDFFADFNQNGMYDAPGDDHAWRLDLDNVMGDTTLMFEHNTSFTDIMWKNRLTVHLKAMTPHVGQDLWLAVVDKNTGMEVDRVHAVVEEEFMVHAYGIKAGESYNVDFFADFNQNGMYDAPGTDHAWRLDLDNVMGDTTLMFEHNTSFTDIMWKNKLTVHFTAMNPHVGQDLWLAVVDKNTGMEVDRVHAVVEEEFMVHAYGIKAGESYNVDFFADFNENGMYDAPGTDHAWRLDLDNVMGDTTLMFEHNTSFTDIMWKNKLTVHFTAMNPHVGQDLWLAVVDKNTGMEVDRVHAVVEEEFMVHAYGIKAGESYNVDFFADFNQNGMYDAPGTDHAWRLDLDNVMGDTTLMFEHNTSFTDIMWKNRLTVHLKAMTPHVGQDLWLAVVDKNTGMEVDRVHAVVEEEFMVHAYGIKAGESYNVDFFADFNENGMYDAPGDDHAWRLDLDNVMGDTTLMFEHNTSFTDIMWKNRLTVHLKAMTPHVGQDLWLAVVDKNTGMEVDRVHAVVEEEFMVHAYGIKAGESYNVDFFADFNENGMYDAPGTDHAWRLDLDNVMGDTTLMFEHNTSFTDIMWKHKLTVEFSGMTPHIGQMLKLYVVNTADGMTKDSVTVQQIAGAEFEVVSYSLMGGSSYHVNFYADFNLNGSYDIPPVDHAWQLTLENVSGDTTLMFSHNTDFTDIFNLTSINENDLGQFRMYPNPTSGKVWIESVDLVNQDLTVSFYDITGKKYDIEHRTFNSRIEMNVSDLKQGIYLVELKTSSQRKMLKLIKE